MSILPSRLPLEAEGERPTVIGLQAGAGSPEQWRPLAERLRLRYACWRPTPRLVPGAAPRARTRHCPGCRGGADSSPCSMRFPARCTSSVTIMGRRWRSSWRTGAASASAGLVLYEPTPFGRLFADPDPGTPPWTSRSCGACSGAMSRRRLVPGCPALCGPPLGRRRVAGPSVQERAAIAHRMPALCAHLDAQLSDPTPARRLRPHRRPGTGS